MFKTVDISKTVEMSQFAIISKSVNMSQHDLINNVVNCLLLSQPSSAMRQARKWGEGPRQGERVRQHTNMSILARFGKSERNICITEEVLSDIFQIMSFNKSYCYK